MTKYVEINGKRYDLDEDGEIRLQGAWPLTRAQIKILGLEVKGGTPKWTIERDGYIYAFQARTDQRLHITDYATGLKELASFVGAFPSEAFTLRKDGVVVATLKGENA